MNRTILKLLDQRVKLALGSLTLVDKQLLEISAVLDNLVENFYAEAIRGEEENSDSGFFISPPLEVYDEVPYGFSKTTDGRE